MTCSCNDTPYQCAQKLGLRRYYNTSWIRVPCTQIIDLASTLRYSASLAGVESYPRSANFMIKTQPIIVDGQRKQVIVRGTVTSILLGAKIEKTAALSYKIKFFEKTEDGGEKPVDPNHLSWLQAVVVTWELCPDEGCSAPVKTGYTVLQPDELTSPLELDLSEKVRTTSWVAGVRIRVFVLPKWQKASDVQNEFKTLTGETLSPEQVFGEFASRLGILASALGSAELFGTVAQLMADIAGVVANDEGGEEKADALRKDAASLIGYESTLINALQEAVSVNIGIWPGAYEATEVSESIPRMPEATVGANRVIVNGIGVDEWSDAAAVASAIYLGYEAWLAVKAAGGADISNYPDIKPVLNASIASLGTTTAGVITGLISGRLIPFLMSLVSHLRTLYAARVHETIPGVLVSIYDTSITEFSKNLRLAPPYPVKVQAVAEPGIFTELTLDLSTLGANTVSLPYAIEQQVKGAFAGAIGIKKFTVTTEFYAYTSETVGKPTKIEKLVEGSSVRFRIEIPQLEEGDYVLTVPLPGDAFPAAIFLPCTGCTVDILVPIDVADFWETSLSNAEIKKAVYGATAEHMYRNPSAEPEWSDGPAVELIDEGYVKLYGFNINAIYAYATGNGISVVVADVSDRVGVANWKDLVLTPVLSLYNRAKGVQIYALETGDNITAWKVKNGTIVGIKQTYIDDKVKEFLGEDAAEPLLTVWTPVPRFASKPGQIPSSAVWYHRGLTYITHYTASKDATSITVYLMRGASNKVKLTFTPLTLAEVETPSGKQLAVREAAVGSATAEVDLSSLTEDTVAIDVTVKFDDVESPTATVNGTAVTVTLPKELSGDYAGIRITAEDATLGIPVVPASDLNRVLGELADAASMVELVATEDGGLSVSVNASAGWVYSENDGVLISPSGASLSVKDLAQLKQLAAFLVEGVNAVFGTAEDVARTVNSAQYAPALASALFFSSAIYDVITYYANQTNKTPVLVLQANEIPELAYRLLSKYGATVTVEPPGITVTENTLGSDDPVLAVKLVDSSLKTPLTVNVFAENGSSIAVSTTLNSDNLEFQVRLLDMAYLAALRDSQIGYVKIGDKTLIEIAENMMKGYWSTPGATTKNMLADVGEVAKLMEYVKQAYELLVASGTTPGSLDYMLAAGYIPYPVQVDVAASGVGMFKVEGLGTDNVSAPSVPNTILQIALAGSATDLPETIGSVKVFATNTITADIRSQIKEKAVEWIKDYLAGSASVYPNVSVLGSYVEYQYENSKVGGFRSLTIANAVPRIVATVPAAAQSGDVLQDFINGSVSKYVSARGVVEVIIDYERPTADPTTTAYVKGLSFYDSAANLHSPVLFKKIERYRVCAGLACVNVVGEDDWETAVLFPSRFAIAVTAVNAQSLGESEVPPPTKALADSISPSVPSVEMKVIPPLSFSEQIGVESVVKDYGDFSTQILKENSYLTMALVIGKDLLTAYEVNGKPIVVEFGTESTATAYVPKSALAAYAYTVLYVNKEVKAGLAEQVSLNGAGERLPLAVANFSLVQVASSTPPARMITADDGSYYFEGTVWDWIAKLKEISGVDVVEIIQYRVKAVNASASSAQSAESKYRMIAYTFSIEGLPDSVYATDSPVRVRVTLKALYPGAPQTIGTFWATQSQQFVSAAEQWDSSGTSIQQVNVRTGGLEEAVNGSADSLKSVFAEDKTYLPPALEATYELVYTSEKGEESIQLGTATASLPQPSYSVNGRKEEDGTYTLTVQPQDTSWVRASNVVAAFVISPEKYSKSQTCISPFQTAVFKADKETPAIGVVVYTADGMAPVFAEAMVGSLPAKLVTDGLCVLSMFDNPAVVFAATHKDLATKLASALYDDAVLNAVDDIASSPFKAGSVNASALVNLVGKSPDEVTDEDVEAVFGSTVVETAKENGFYDELVRQVKDLVTIVNELNREGVEEPWNVAAFMYNLPFAPRTLVDKASVLADILRNVYGVIVSEVGPGLRVKCDPTLAANPAAVELSLDGPKTVDGTLLLGFSEPPNVTVQPAQVCSLTPPIIKPALEPTEEQVGTTNLPVETSTSPLDALAEFAQQNPEATVAIALLPWILLLFLIFS